MANFVSYFFLTVIFCFVSVIIAKECESCCGTKSSNNNPEIDYVQLTVQNAQGFCALKKCNAPVSGWTIHGLWPSQKGVMGPNSCNSSANFDPTLLNALMSAMDKEWPTLFGGDSTGFWCHEWCKHGTCAMVASEVPVTSMISFFQTTLSLFGSLNIDDSLAKSGITHSPDNKYKLSDFIATFSSKPAFECSKHGDGQILFQARFCFTPDLKPTDCNMDWFASLKSCRDDVPIYYI